MAHNLATSTQTSKPASFYVGDRPWHGRGVKLDRPATASEAMQAAGLGYDVELRALSTSDGTDVPMRRAVVRVDTSEVLGSVGKKYRPISNREAFAFMDSLVADGSIRYHSAGTTGNGARVWLLAKSESAPIRVGNTDDVVEPYLLLSNSHDGTGALKVIFTPTRVTCANMIRLAERSGAGRGIAIVHKGGDLSLKIAQAQKVLGLATTFFGKAAEQINALARHSPSQEQLNWYFNALFPNPAQGNVTRAVNTRERLNELFETGIGHDSRGIKGTTWALLNAVTEYIDHHRPSRGKTPQAQLSQRVASSLFGSGAAIKGRAWSLAMELALGG